MMTTSEVTHLPWREGKREKESERDGAQENEREKKGKSKSTKDCGPHHTSRRCSGTWFDLFPVCSSYGTLCLACLSASPVPSAGQHQEMVDFREWPGLSQPLHN